MPATSTVPELRLLPEQPRGRSWQSWLTLGGLAGAAEFFLFFLLLQAAGTPSPELPRRQVIEHHVPLYMPREFLTQRQPNRHTPTKEVTEQQLANSPSIAAQAAHAAVRPQPQAQKPGPPTPPPPAITASNETAPLPPVIGSVPLPPAPQPMPSKQTPAIQVPKLGVNNAIQSLAKNQQQTGQIIEEARPARPQPGMLGTAGASRLPEVGAELKTDSNAADVREYVRKILQIVKANSARVTPESVRMGTLRGENTVELIIDHNGSIPKLVLGDPSNITALDRASVAAVSMSNPFPPLPDDFKGAEFRLALTFRYNISE